MNIAVYMDFVINFLILIAIFINLLLIIASIFKNKDYSLEVVLLGMASFFVFFGIHEFMQLAITSYRLSDSTTPLGDSIISEMFLLMASMLVFGVGVMKNRLKDFKLGKKK
jgi:hypothetical protein